MARVDIISEMVECVKDEGRQATLDTLQRWQSSLEEMAEIADAKERAACSTLLVSVNTAIAKILEARE